MSEREPNYNEDGNMHIDVRNDYVYAKHPQKISIFAMRLLRIAIAQCRMGDGEFYQYAFSIPKLAEMIGCDRHNIYKVADEATDQLLMIILKTGKMAPRKKGHKFHVFETCEYSEKGEVVLKLSDDMKELLLKLKPGFSEIPIAPMLMMQSKYAIRLYELICQTMGIKNMPYANISTGINISVDDIRLVTGTDQKKTYDHISHLKSKVLLPALADIEKCADWKIICKDIKDSRRITGFTLEIWDRNGYEVVEHCKQTGQLLPGRFQGVIPGQMNIFDWQAMEWGIDQDE